MNPISWRGKREIGVLKYKMLWFEGENWQKNQSIFVLFFAQFYKCMGAKMVLGRVMDGEGMLHTIRKIQLLTSEEKTHSGIRTLEHLCRINLGGRMENVKLVFTKETCKWTPVVL